MMTVMIRKELQALFVSPLAWLLLALVQSVFAWFFLLQLDAFLGLQSQLRQLINSPGITEIIVTPVFAIAAVVLLMMTPILSMRLFAEERRHHTLPLLISAPISITDIVLGKFIAMMCFYGVIIALLLVLSLSLLMGGTVDFGLLWSNVIGLALLTACFCALGLYISTLTSQPAFAAIGCLAALLGLWIIDWIGRAGGNVHYLSLWQQFRQFNQGLIDTFSLVYCVLFVVFFLTLTIRYLDGERLHG
jgi:ABC-2 type transport system permease protein